MVKVKDLYINSRKVQITVKVIAKVPPRYNKGFKITEYTVADPTGTIVVPFWNNDAEMVEIGDFIKIENGYVSEYKGRLQLNIGRYGSFDHVNPSEDFQIQEYPTKRVPLNIKETIPIEDLNHKTKNLSLCIYVKEIIRARKVKTRRDGNEHLVRTFLVGDSTGCILFDLWDDWSDLIQVDKSYYLHNTYIRIYKGQRILNIARYGKIIPSELDIQFNGQTNISEVSEMEGEGFFSF